MAHTRAPFNSNWDPSLQITGLWKINFTESHFQAFSKFNLMGLTGMGYLYFVQSTRYMRLKTTTDAKQHMELYARRQRLLTGI